jgi:hypothetical protein
MSDTASIKAFLTDIYGWLERCYTGTTQIALALEYPVIPVRPSVSQLAREAWNEFNEHLPLSTLIRKVDNASEMAMRDNGLYGAQLKYKLSTISHAVDMVFSGFTGWKKKLLDLIDNLLESILSALGVGEALKELKDALVDSLPDEA